MTNVTHIHAAAAPRTGSAAACVPGAGSFDGRLLGVGDWDAAYDNRGAVPEFDGILAEWERDAPAFRAEMAAAGRARLDRPYGDGAREKFDLFLPEGAPRGLALFIHGGWWMRFDRTLFSHLAAGAVARGWAAALPSYPLAPGTPVSAITRAAARFVAAAAVTVPEGCIALAGHSAGGHLAARMVCADQRHPPGVAERIARCVTVSGVHDLRPLLAAGVGPELRLSEAEAAAESPALLRPAPNTRLLAWVGGDELPEFRRQSALLANAWRGLGALTAFAEAPGRNHFDVIEGFSRPNTALTEAFLGGL
ncbi:alpha/beta hydrolase [Rhodovulum sp. DZ06]|uniref:alpha/beta hydrolase n=1 Tax=Rhodovulum sp. DZ06 TaxID=3425126 RepID=UPI003D355981